MRSSDDIQGMGFAGVLFDLGKLGCGDFGVIGFIVGELLSRATLLVDPTGDDNSVLYTAKQAGAGGEDISVEYAAVATSAETTVAVVGDAITVTPGSKARMVVTGVTTPGVNGTAIYCGIINGKPAWSTDGTQTIGAANVIVSYTGTPWFYWKISLPGAYSATVDSVADTPNGESPWVVVQGSGTPTVTAGISSAAQVIAAVNAYPAAAALVTASESGAATGPVAAVAAAFLIYPEVLTLAALDLTLAGIDLTID